MMAVAQERRGLRLRMGLGEEEGSDQFFLYGLTLNLLQYSWEYIYLMSIRQANINKFTPIIAIVKQRLYMLILKQFFQFSNTFQFGYSHQNIYSLCCILDIFSCVMCLLSKFILLKLHSGHFNFDFMLIKNVRYIFLNQDIFAQ